MKEFHNYLFLVILLVPCCSQGQVPNAYNFNITNGLPSNHVYNTARDAHGYLWIATKKGVVRYNGYDFKLFDLSSGLGSADVWQLFEDRKGRMWVGSISDDIGYIYNNKYYKARLKNFNTAIYPGSITENKNGVFFTNSITGQISLCQESNGTITNYPASDSLYTIPTHSSPIHILFPLVWYNSDQEYSLLIRDSLFYKFEVDHGKARFSRIPNMHLPEFRRMTKNHNLVLNNSFISYVPGNSQKFTTIDLVTGNSQAIDINHYGRYNNILYIFPAAADSSLYVITDNYILQFVCKPSIRFIRQILINDLIPGNKINGNKICAISNDPFWGLCTGTTTDGLWTTCNAKNNFIPRKDLILDNYSYLGSIGDSLFFWWNSSKRTLAQLGKDLKIKYRTYSNIHGSLGGITSFDNDRFILFGSVNYLLHKKNGKIIELPLNSSSGTITEKPGTIIATTSIGLARATYITDSGFRLQILAKNRYKGLTYDSVRQVYLAYNSDNVFIYDAGNNKGQLLSKETLRSFGITKIEKILCDKFGNIFFQGNDRLTIYDPRQNRYKELLKNFNLKDASCFIINNTLTVIGSFGVSFSKIQGYDKISKPFLSPNIKSINYTAVYDCQVSSRSIILNTDKGIYEVKFPDERQILEHKSDEIPYKLILNYKDSISNIATGDTVFIDQKDLRLQFDIINPIGTGKAKYKYKLQSDSTWHELNANELTLSSLHPDKYYCLSLRISDNSWVSDKVDIHLYVVPYWWQTATGRKTLWTFAIASVILLLTVSVIVTRKLVLTAAQKRSMRMELELKAIYAQINPHFIFNTLNSALLLVRKKRFEEAYSHISRFSRLLRSYIKSSRNKLITIADEVANLHDYLELQKTRFGNTFDYTIFVDDKISPALVKIPSLLLQPFVENAINHGLLRKKGPGHLQIEFRTGNENTDIVCTVDDDGIGRNAAQAGKEESAGKESSFGDLLINDLINIFNKYEQMNIKIDYFDKQIPLTGTTVNIYIENPHYG